MTNASNATYNVALSASEISLVIDCLHDVDGILRAAEAAGVDPALDGAVYDRDLLHRLADRLYSLVTDDEAFLSEHRAGKN